MSKKVVTNDMILGAVTSLNKRFDNLEERMSGMATKVELEDFKEEILEEIRPIARAVDKDAVTILDHEKRLKRLELKKA